MKFGLLNDATLFFLLKNIFIIAESIRQIAIAYIDYKKQTNEAEVSMNKAFIPSYPNDMYLQPYYC